MTVTKILHVLPFLHKGGVEAFVMSYFRHIDREKFSFTFLAMGDGNEYENEIISLGGSVVHADITFSKAKELPANLLKMVRTLKGLDYDVIHSNINQYNGLVFLASLLAGKKRLFISHSHGSDFEDDCGTIFRKFVYNKLIYRLTSSLSDVRLACGQNAGEKLYGGAGFNILTNAIDPDKWTDTDGLDSAALRRKLGIKDTAHIYSSISRYDRNKNLPFFVDIFNEIRKIDEDAHMIVGGTSGECEEEVRNKVREYGLGDCSTVMGSCDNMRGMYCISDCWFVPSYFEGLPFSLIEAQACGLNVLVTDTIDRAADMGLGLVHYCSLSEGARFWAETAVKHKGRIKDKSLIERAISSKGYSICENASKLEDIYSKAIEICPE